MAPLGPGLPRKARFPLREPGPSATIPFRPMRTPIRTGLWPLACLLVAMLLAAAPRLQAQINLDLKLDRTLYLTSEPIVGELTIVNLAGRDLIFGESGGINWLDFTITDGRGHLITPVQG